MGRKMSSQDNLALVHRRMVLLTIAILACLSAIASDIYTPSVPIIAQYMKVHTDLVQLTMAVFLAGVAASQLIYGPISDSWGRKKPLLLGMAIMFVGSTLSYAADDIHTLMWARLIQGLGAGAPACLFRSIFRDAFSGVELVKYGSYLGSILVFVVPVAPVIGGYLQHHFNWQASFMFINAYIALAFCFVVILYHDIKPDKGAQVGGLTKVRASFVQLLSHPHFIGYSMCALLSYGVLFSWVTAAPVLLIKHVGLSPSQFGWVIFASTSVSMAIAGLVNGRLVSSFGMAAMLRLGWRLIILGGLMLALSYALFGLTLWSLIVPICLVLFGNKFTFPCTFSGAMTPFGHMAGYAGALYGTLQITGGAIIGALVAYLPEDTPWPLVGIFVLCPLLCFFIHTYILAKK
jgi:Bcr/CflA subfamily drug resistance transporter